METRPLLSLAMIVRDEATALPALFAAHGGLWDEAVVVDTGSRDGTPAVAAALGARVATFSWTDDFAAARNAALALCRGTWILVLDADEHIALGDQVSLRDHLAAAAPAGFSLPQFNYTDEASLSGWLPVTSALEPEARGAAGYVLARQVRVFPGDPALRYRGCVHETVEPDLLARGWPVLPLAVAVHHHGHRTPGAAERRRERDGRLLRAKLAAAPTDPRARFEMATQLLRERQPALARRLLEHLVAEAPDGPRAAEAWRLLARLALAERRDVDAREAAHRAVALRPDEPDGWTDLVRVLAAAGEADAAGAALARFADLFPRDARLATLLSQVQKIPVDISNSPRDEV